MVCDSDGWAMSRCSAARVKPSWSTTARKYLSCRTSTCNSFLPPAPEHPGTVPTDPQSPADVRGAHRRAETHRFFLWDQ